MHIIELITYTKLTGIYMYYYAMYLHIRTTLNGKCPYKCLYYVGIMYIVALVAMVTSLGSIQHII